MSQQDERGASAVEFGLLVAGIAGIITAMVFLLGATVRDSLFDKSCDDVAANFATSVSSPASCDN